MPYFLFGYGVLDASLWDGVPPKGYRREISSMARLSSLS